MLFKVRHHSNHTRPTNRIRRSKNRNCFLSGFFPPPIHLILVCPVRITEKTNWVVHIQGWLALFEILEMSQRADNFLRVPTRIMRIEITSLLWFPSYYCWHVHSVSLQGKFLTEFCWILMLLPAGCDSTAFATPIPSTLYIWLSP